MSAVCAALALAVTACGGTEPESPEAAESHAEHTGVSRVYFVEPTDGATIKSEAQLVFGSEMFAIAPVPPGEIADADVRPGTGHYHVAIDADCLPAGQIIPKADPWIHFGSGANTAEIALTPGTHRLTVQAGDDQHRTTEGLCETITVNVVG
jgi:hypothetical protein